MHFRRSKSSLHRREFIRRLTVLAGAGASGIWHREESAAAVPGQPEAKPSTLPREGPSALPPRQSAPPLALGATTLLWDGASGVSAGYFNYGAGLPWQNAGGDWTDANGLGQGPVPYASVMITAAGQTATDITGLAKRWYGNGNTGLFLKVTKDAVRIAARTNADSTLAPVVVLTLDDNSSVTCTCAGSAVADVSSASPQPGPVMTAQTTSHVCLQFGLPSLGSRAISHAVLKLTATQVFGTFSADVLELRPPRIFSSGTPLLGLADKYPLDAGIAADPAVRFATQFSDKAWNTKSKFPGYVAPDSVVAHDPSLGTRAINVKYHVGEFSPFATDHRFSPKQVEQQSPTDCPRELYFRYYLKLKTGYQCSVQGKKLPGLAGRYGWWNPSSGGYYQAVDGNGGSPTLGTKLRYAPSPNGYYYSGWSMRHQAAPGPVDGAANPYGAAVQAYTYAYYATMQGPYGDSWRWGNPVVGYVGFNPDQWYCIEQYVKVNTVTAPFDALGNGTGVADGIIRGWVDGVLVFERTNVVFRKHPAIKIDEVWLDHYHGGTEPAEVEHPFAMANVVVADAYIGPMKRGTRTTGAPAWLAGAAVNQWVQVPNSVLHRADRSALIAAGLVDANGNPTSYGNPDQITAFSGGALKAATSELMIFGGGGAGAWAGNDVRALKLSDDAPAWKFAVKPTNARYCYLQGDPNQDIYNKDGSPNGRHSYRSLQFIDRDNRLMVFGGSSIWPGDAGQYYHVDAVTLGGTWQTRVAPDMPIANGWQGYWIVKHPTTEDVYISDNFKIIKWTGSVYVTLWDSGGHSGVDRGVAAIDQINNILLRLGDWSTTNIPLAIDLNTGTVTVGVLSGRYASAVNVTVGISYAAGMVFDSTLGKFLLFQDDGYLYTIGSAGAGAWTVDRLATTGAAPAAGKGQPYSRMQYVPNLKGVVLMQQSGQPVYFVRTA